MVCKMVVTNFLYRFLRYIVQFYFYSKYKITVYNKEKLPKKYTGSYIIACNHQSYSDPPAISAVVKGRFSFMAKKELFERGLFFKLLIKMCGAFPVDRGAKDSSAIDRSISDIKKGKIFVIFPEGTRSKDGKIGRAKSGVALIAATAAVPVLPVCIMYGLGGNKKSLDFAVGDMIPAKEVTVDDLEGEGRKALKRVSSRILDSIKELQVQILTERGEALQDE
jgi:1-acyl-sn-glycerol-3-phosphate acyltransferase